jgi:hypothetical protein
MEGLTGSPPEQPRRGDETRHVERLGRHRDLPGLVPPRAPRPVGVYLDAEAVGIGEVDRLAHEVIRHPRIDAEPGQMGHEPAQCRAIAEER